MALELNGTTGVSLVQDGSVTSAKIADGSVVAADLNSALSDTIGKVKAWVNFNGTGTVAIRASYGVSSITDNGSGDYTVNFTTAMVDANYCATFVTTKASGSGAMQSAIHAVTQNGAATLMSTTQLRVINGTTTSYDQNQAHVAIFR